MRYLIISDIHGNLQAFEAVLSDAKGLYDKIWCLGGLASVGPYPNECVELLLTLDHLCVASASDWTVLGKSDSTYGKFDISDDFNPKAQASYLQTRERLTSQVREYLDNLPPILIEDDFTLVHGSPRHPLWEYMLFPAVADQNFPYLKTKYGLNGHTHSPAVFQEPDKPQETSEIFGPDIEGDIENSGNRFQLGKRRLMVCPGSIGGGIRLVSGQFSFYILLDTVHKNFEFKHIPLKSNPFRPLG